MFGQLVARWVKFALRKPKISVEVDEEAHAMSYGPQARNARFTVAKLGSLGAPRGGYRLIAASKPGRAETEHVAM